MSRNLLVTLFVFGAGVLPAQTPVVQAVVSAANYSPLYASGSWVAIFGTDLAPAESVVTTLPLPMEVGGVSVSLQGIAKQTYPLPLRYVASGQINALIPPDLASGSYGLTVKTPAGVSAEFATYVSKLAPAIYTRDASGFGPALVFDVNFRAVTEIGSDPIVLYASGLGPTNPPGTVDGGNTSEPFNRLTVPPFVDIGGAAAQVLFAGLAPGLPGVYQLNVIPAAGSSAANSLSINGSEVATLPIAVGANTKNVSGKITAVYPASTTMLQYSAELQAASFTAAFDIAPNAQPFYAVAACGGAAMRIAFNPGAGTWQATSNMPVSAVRSGDFSAATDGTGRALGRILDYFNNNMEFPNNTIPLSRLDPGQIQALQAIPLPNYSGDLQNVNYVVSGAIPADGHFVVDASNNASIANFGDFVNTSPFGTLGQGDLTMGCTLTVDGVVVDSRMVTFR